MIAKADGWLKAFDHSTLSKIARLTLLGDGVVSVFWHGDNVCDPWLWL